jgi:hypothetical protein
MTTREAFGIYLGHFGIFLVDVADLRIELPDQVDQASSIEIGYGKFRRTERFSLGSDYAEGRGRLSGR